VLPLPHALSCAWPRNSRRGVESRTWNAGLRRELAHAVFNGQTAVAHGQAGLRRSIGSQAISSLVETCRCQVNTESPYASTLNNRKRQETKPACRTLHASSRACANGAKLLRLNLQTHNPSTHVVTVDSLLHRREGRIILCLAANHIPEITRARHLGATEPTDDVLLMTTAGLLGAWFFTCRGFIFEKWFPANR
jgi:hypothetical protein